MKRDRYREINWQEIVYYDETSRTGLRWKVSPSYKCKPGDEAGSAYDNRWIIRYKDKNYKCHVIIWSLFNTLNDGMVIDHFDRNALNNKISNLRGVTMEVNMRNRKKPQTNKTGKTGVYFSEAKEVVVKIPSYYAAVWTVDGKKFEKRFSIGDLTDEEAFRLACEYRDNIINQLNADGFGYTETHGQ